MQRQGNSIAFAIFGHGSMGAALGAALAAWLMTADLHPLCDLVNASSDPGQTIVIFGACTVAMFAIGAALTGWMFLIFDDANRKAGA